MSIFLYIILGILIVVLLLALILFFSSVRVEVKYLKLESHKSGIDKDYFITIYLSLGKKIKWFKINLDKSKMEKYKQYGKMKVIYKYFNKDLIKKIIKNRFSASKKRDILLEKIDLKIEVGLEDILLSTYINVFITTVISILASRIVENKNDCKYEIIPIYRQENVFRINLNCIIKVKMEHIINILFNLIRGEENGRTSNRKTHVWSHE